MAYVANTIMKQFHLKELPVDNFRYYCGEGANMLMRRCLKDAGDEELLHYEEGQRIYREMFAADPMYHVRHYPGMPETIQELKKLGMRLAVCSNKPHPAAVKVIETMFGDAFELVLGQSSEIPRKPAPDGPLYIAKQLGALPEECMYIGDTRTDMLTGKSAGMFTVGALWGFRTLEELESSGADAIAETPEDLLDLCEGARE
jgi:phosphoglycolate phosphatase